MSTSSVLPNSCPKCGAALPSDATDGLCPNCLMNEAMQATIVSDASKPKVHSAILTPEQLAPFFPQYEFLRMLGRGGMGAVYLARQISLNRLVAIKILPADMGESDQGFAERFKNEAQAMAQLSHPGIVAVFDFGQTAVGRFVPEAPSGARRAGDSPPHQGLLYIVMEYIEGTDVQLMLASQGRLHSAHAMAITAHVCDALQYAHSRGIIHRDIKPSNIMVSNDGVVKVADFGLAKMSQGQTTGLTQSGMAMGTPHFMAPEALTLGSAVDQRADIYAVGVMLYQMLTGKLPQGMFEMPSFQVPGLDPRYDRIVARALRDDREQRYQAAVDLRHDLDAILTQPVEKTTPDAETEVKALPPVEARGRKKARVPALPSPNAAAPASGGKKPVGLILTVLGVVAALVAAFVFSRDHGVGSPTPTIAVTSSAVLPLSSSATGKAINLLELVDVNRDAVKGDWEKTPEGLVLKHEGNARDAKVLEFDYLPPEEYDFIMEFTVTGGQSNDNVNQYIAAQGRSFAWKLNASPDGGVYAFDLLDNTPAITQNEAAYSGEKLIPRRRYRSVVEVRRNSLRALLDDAEIVRWSGDFKRLSMESINKLRDDRHLGVGSFGRGVIFHRVEVREMVSSPSPSTATKDAPFVNTLGMKFVPVPIGGGTSAGQRVLFGVWDVRVQDYAAYAAANPNADGSWKTQERDGVPAGRAPDHPVVGVNWEDAQAFCQWLTEKENAAGKLPKGLKYRLPSDEEWSWAVGLPPESGATPADKSEKNSLDFPWGKDWPPTNKVGNYADEKFHGVFPKDTATTKNLLWIRDYDDGYVTTSPVGSFPANAHGLYDMGGNVWQWCEDWFDKDQKDRVWRGGCWGSSGQRGFLSSFRARSAPDHRGYINGFRCVLAAAVDTVSPSPSLPDSKSSTSTATKDAPFTNTLGMKFVPVPITGGPTDGQRVLFSVWETRVQDYAGFVKETKREWLDPGYAQGLTHPAVNVSWDAATAYCTWLTEREHKAGRLGADLLYRLPSDHEWSCAVGIGEQEDASRTPSEKSNKIAAVYPWESSWPPQPGAGNYSGLEVPEHPGYEDRPIIPGYRDAFLRAAPVGSFKPNLFGLHDLGGNAYEWCENWGTSDRKSRVRRGGSFVINQSALLLSSNRSLIEPTKAAPDFGFRVVLAPAALPLPVLSGSRPPPPAATKDAPFINTLGMKFVPVPITGGPTDGKRVLFCIHETRKADYAAFAAANPSVDYSWAHPNKIGNVPISPAGDHPVVSVNWRDAQAFCAWLSQKEGRRYRLPTDHEWSCASGIGDREDANESPHSKSGKVQGIYAWGIEWPPPKGAGNFDDDSRETNQPAPGGDEFKGYDDGFPATAPVMSFLPNRLGLYDLGGNVWEWCEDWWNAEQEQRIQRGACYTHGAALSSARAKIAPDIRRSCDGFRVVLDDSPLTANEETPPPSPTTLPSTEPLKIHSEVVTKEAPFVNSLGMKFVPVSGIKTLFCIHTTRMKDFAAFANAMPGLNSNWKAMPPGETWTTVQDEYPVANLSWAEAQAFCEWLGRKEGHRYRLPTDHEWSIAAGIGPQEEGFMSILPRQLSGSVPNQYPWGGVWPPPKGAGNFCDMSCQEKRSNLSIIDGYKDGFANRSPVMRFTANQFGLFDMGGNVRQWCEDWYDEKRTERVVRGSSWYDHNPEQILSSYRGHFPQMQRRDTEGFRCVLELAGD